MYSLKKFWCQLCEDGEIIVPKRVGPMSKSVGPMSKSVGPMSKSVGPMSKSVGPMSKSVRLNYRRVLLIFSQGFPLCLNILLNETNVSQV